MIKYVAVKDYGSHTYVDDIRERPFNNQHNLTHTTRCEVRTGFPVWKTPPKVKIKGVDDGTPKSRSEAHPRPRIGKTKKDKYRIRKAEA